MNSDPSGLEVHLCTCNIPQVVTSSAFGAETVSPYVSVPTRRRSSSGHGIDWRTGVDCQCTGSFTQCQPSVVTMGTWPMGDPEEHFVNSSYHLPHHCMTYRFSVGEGPLLQTFFVVLLYLTKKSKEFFTTWFLITTDINKGRKYDHDLMVWEDYPLKKDIKYIS